ncbi:hypothetical protein NM688_g5510 [Phlebia brevispora]|uniref:Uncharacterized protein n=1 Tax=Phlebia brevispora TaxID=194682 RepID=A0ACC1SUA1_9APHY|nr:hypothetical protein NM688_g5510 [Phlebia brevispora]
MSPLYDQVKRALASITRVTSRARSSTPIRALGEPDSMALPLELVLHVLSFITSPLEAGISAGNWNVTELYNKDERRSQDMLLACSRVCRTWRQLTLPYLYSTVAMYYDPRRKHSFRTVHRYYRSLEDFVTFLSVFPGIQRHIRELRLALSEDDCGGDIDPTTFAATRRHYCNLNLLAERFLKETLLVRWIDWKSRTLIQSPTG